MENRNWKLDIDMQMAVETCCSASLLPFAYPRKFVLQRVSTAICNPGK